VPVVKVERVFYFGSSPSVGIGENSKIAAFYPVILKPNLGRVFPSLKSLKTQTMEGSITL
jgi:hypothetical protein